MPPLTDTHCHLYLDRFANDLPDVLDRAGKADLARMLVPGIDVVTSAEAVRLAEEHPFIYAAVGMHPNHASGWTPQTRDELFELSKHPKVVAIGEIGLDYYRDHTPWELQNVAFKEQLALAAERRLPVIVHNRQSSADLYPILISWQERLAEQAHPLADHPGVLHSFQGSQEEAMQAVSHHYMLGISGPITFPNSGEMQALIPALPLSNILLETDAPYLAPVPFRGKRNEPAHVVYIAGKIAELTRRDAGRIAETTTQNAANLFGWGD